MLIICATESEWLEQRRKSVGGSDAPALFGVHPQLSAFRVALTKAGKCPPQVETEAMAGGRYFEPAIRKWFMDRSGLEVTWPGKHVIYRSDNWPWMHMSPDGFIDDHRGRGVVQFKRTHYPLADFAEGEPLRLAFDIQLQHEMVVTDSSWGYLVVQSSSFGDRLEWYYVERNDEFCDVLIKKCQKFMDDVAAGVFPEVDGSQDSAVLLRHLHPNDNGKTAFLSVDDAIVFEEWDKAQRDYADSEKRLMKARNRLAQKIGPNTFGVLPNGVRLSYRTQTDEKRVLRKERR